MKRLLLFVSAVGLLTLGSCSKDRVCECTDQNGDTVNFEQKDQTLNEARTECQGREYDQTILGVHTSLDCRLR